MQSHLTNNVRSVRVSDAVAVGTSAVNGSVVDSQHFDGVRFLAFLGAVTDGTPSLKVQGGAAADGSDMVDLEGTATTGAATDDNKVLLVDVLRPRAAYRYLRCVLTRGGSTGAVVDAMLAELYIPRLQPVAKDATIAVQELHISPGAGTP